MNIEFKPEETPEVTDNVIYLDSPERDIINHLEYLLEEAKKKNILCVTLCAELKSGGVFNSTVFLEDANLYSQVGLVEEAKADLMDSIRASYEL